MKTETDFNFLNGNHVLSEKEMQEQEKIYYEKEMQCHISDMFGLRYADSSFDNYLTSSKEQEQVKQLCIDYIKADKSKGQSLIMYGKPGTGKNHLLAAMYRSGLNFMPVKIEYINAEKMAMQKNGQNWMMAFSKYINTSILVIPDLIIRSNGLSDSIKEILYYLIDERYNNFKPVIICTNVDIPELKKAIDFDGSDRVSDRLREMIGDRLCCMNWETYRDENNFKDYKPVKLDRSWQYQYYTGNVNANTK